MIFTLVLFYFRNASIPCVSNYRQVQFLMQLPSPAEASGVVFLFNGIDGCTFYFILQQRDSMRLLSLVFILFFAACTQNSEVKKKLSGTDSLVVNFYAPQSDSIIKSVATAEKKAIRRLSDFVSTKETSLFKCGYDGNLHFFEKGKMVSDVSFKYSDESCRHFVLDVEGKLTGTTMSTEAADFLKSLSEGRDIYW